MTTHEPDDDLRARLHAVDPARSLEPLDDDRILRMLNTTTSSDSSPAASRRRRRPLIFGLAGATGIAAAALAVASLLPSAPAAATRLVMPADPGGAASSCPMIEPAFLKGFTLAFEGRVTSTASGEVTLNVTQVFTGEPGTVVVIEQPSLQASDFSGFEFRDGADYLISSLEPALPSGDSEIALCGFSGPASPELLAIYEAAFR